MDIVFQIISILFWFVIILIPLVVIHEFGHLLMSKLVGVKVTEFGVGIPPRVFYKRWKGMTWSLNWIPLGGFAKIYGDHDAIDQAQDEVKKDPELAKANYLQNRVSELLTSKDLKFFLEDNNLEYSVEWKEFEDKFGDLGEDREEKSKKMLQQLETLVSWEFDQKLGTKEAFVNVSWWRQAVILLGGVTFNLITAFVLFFILVTFISTPPSPALGRDIAAVQEFADITYRSEYINILQVQQDSAAWEAGIRPGDSLISFGGRELSDLQTFDEFYDLVQANKGQPVSVVYRSQETGEIVTKEINLKEVDGEARFGVNSQSFGYSIRYRAKNLWSGLGMAGRSVGNIALLNVGVLGQLVTAPFQGNFGTVRENLGGPVAVGNLGGFIFDQQGFVGIIFIMAVISVSLAVFNLLPIPALDGGRLIIVTLNKITRRRNKKLEAVAIGATFVFMLLLAGLIAVNDIVRIASGGGF